MRKILVVEDNDVLREMIRRYLEREGYGILTAANGARAILIAQTEQPNLILMDLSLPVLDGWQATRQLKAMAETYAIPIIALTANTSPGTRERAMAAGCDEYETKPINLPQLLSKIEALLNAAPVHSLSLPTSALLTQSLWPANGQPTPAVARSPETASILVVDDDRQNRFLITTTLQRLGYTITTAASGIEALGLLQQQSFDLVLLDIMMPEVDGYQVLAQIRQREAWHNLSVVVVSALNETESVVRCIQLGADDYLFKPFERVLLEARVKACLEKKRLRDRETAQLRASRSVTEDLLHSSQTHLQSVIASAPVILSAFGLDGKCTFMAGQELGTLGLRAHEVIGRTVHEIFGAVPEMVIGIESALAGESVTILTVMNGLTFECRHSPSYDQDNQQDGAICVATDVTERLEAEYRFRMLVEKIQVGVTVYNAQGQMILSNPAARALLGLSEEQLQAMPLGALSWDVIHEDGSPFPGDDQPASIALRMGEPVRDVVIGIRRSLHNDRIWLLVNATPQIETDGSVSQVITSFQDISELQRSEARYRQMFEGNQAIKLLIDPLSGRIVKANTAAAQFYGYPQEVLEEMGIGEINILPSQRLSTEMGDALSGENSYFLFRHRLASGEMRDVEVYSSPIEAVDGPLLYSIIHDITARREAEKNNKFQADILAQIKDAVIAVDSSHIVTYWNHSAEEMYGISATEALGLPLQEVYPYLWPPDEAPMHASIARSGKWDSENIHVMKSGSVIYTESSISPLKDETGSPAGYLMVVRDTTLRKETEKQLQASEERYRVIVEDQTELICRFLPSEGTLTFVNVAFCRYFERERLDLIGRNFFALLLPPEEHPALLAQLAQLSRDLPTIIIEHSMLLEGNGVSWQQWTFRAIYDRRGSLVEYQAVGQDITDRKQREHEHDIILRITTALRTTQTRSEMMKVILDQMMMLLQADGAALVSYDHESEESFVEMARGWQHWAGVGLTERQGISNQVMASREPYLSDEGLSDHRASRTVDTIKSVACVPMIVNEQTIGCLWIGRRKRRIAREEVRLLTAIGDMAASALHRASLHEQTRRRLDRLVALHDIDKAITTSFDLDITLQSLLTQLISQLQVDAAAVLKFRPLTRRLVYAAFQGFRTPISQSSALHADDDSLSTMVAREIKSVSLLDLSASKDRPLKGRLVANENFRAYIAVPLVAKNQVKGVLEIFHRLPLRPDTEWFDFLETLGTQAAIAIDNAELFENLQRSNDVLAQAYDETLAGWSRALDLRDHETEGHSQRVTDLTLRLAHALGLSDEELVHMRRGALLHDIGKMGIPDTVLLKPGPLTDDEWTIMRRHPDYAFEMLSPIVYLRPALDIPQYHHERWDGSGYPRGLKGEAIPLGARIFAVVDVWDALCSDRPYRAGWSQDRVRGYLREQSGILFDPRIVEAFLSIDLGPYEAH